ncbi:hypothetical protein RUM44_003817 [Polyplax serrata]|uniref:PID domain-containing protein n=1 Tax=Polyplax serrata TaxID=468196 RepID=A0ABR1B132_POLSC
MDNDTDAMKDSKGDSCPVESGEDSLVSTNNEKNEKLTEMSKMEAKLGEDADDGDEIDDDWFVKLSNSRDGPRVPPVHGTSEISMNCTNIPLLCEDDLNLRKKTMKTLRVGMKKIWRRGSATITVEDPTYKVAYLGNVLTGWAKGEGCIEKPLNSLWKNYNGSSKPDVQMKITVTQSGLKAVTKDHGLIEYWSHRITYCTVPPGLPRVFCWIYRHEGRKLKQELRCHAILCPKESMAARMATTLKLRLTQALIEFKRDKVLRQNARLSLANSVYDNPSLPRRKILLSTGCHNYKPPLERSKSAPKLMSIEESLEEEESTPKVKRKSSGGEETKGDPVSVGIVRNSCPTNRANLEDVKCEYKLTNLNIVKKLCSSIENLVESTSNYSKKFFTERKSSREFYLPLKKTEDALAKKLNEDTEDLSKKLKSRKIVTFEINGEDFSCPVKCTDFKKIEEEEGSKPVMEITLEVTDQESDEGSNSLQSISSCCSDVSSLVTTSSDRSSEITPSTTDGDILLACGDHLIGSETSMERLETYLSNCSDVYLDEVVLHPTGRTENEEEEEETEDVEPEISYGESSYVDLAENLVKKLSLDRKEKDVPYHKIIKSAALSQRQLQSSCLQI